jgi:hypothetical protein
MGPLDFLGGYASQRDDGERDRLRYRRMRRHAGSL